MLATVSACTIDQLAYSSISIEIQQISYNRKAKIKFSEGG